MRFSALILVLLLAACGASSPTRQGTTRVEIDQTEPCDVVKTLARKSHQTLMEPYILGGEHIEALYLQWDDVFRIWNDEELLKCISTIPRNEQGAIAHFLAKQEELSRTHPQVMAVVQSTRITTSPALTITAQEDAKR
jgi:hypothetical protein